MARTPKDHNTLIAVAREKAADRIRKLKEKEKLAKAANGNQNARFLRQSAVHDLTPAARMGAFLELEDIMKRDSKAVDRWTKRGEAHFRSDEPTGPRLVAERSEAQQEHHEGPAAA